MPEVVVDFGLAEAGELSRERASIGVGVEGLKIPHPFFGFPFFPRVFVGKPGRPW